MLNISYSSADTKLAEQMQSDLGAAGLRLDKDILIILLSAAAKEDEAIQEAIKAAQAKGTALAPILLEKMPLPEILANEAFLDLGKGYDKNKVIAFIKQVDLSKETKQGNRRLLFYVGGTALLVFFISIASLATGFVAAPNDEFATENALQDAQIETVTAPELEIVRPRSTDDALNFPATVEAARNNLQDFMIGTATAIPLELQASAQALETQIVQTSTAIFVQTQAVVTPEATEE